MEKSGEGRTAVSRCCLSNLEGSLSGRDEEDGVHDRLKFGEWRANVY